MNPQNDTPKTVAFADLPKKNSSDEEEENQGLLKKFN
jgi:hypothetical protein